MLIYDKSEGIREVKSSFSQAKTEGAAQPPLCFLILFAWFNFSDPFGFVINEHKFSQFSIFSFSHFSQFPFLNFLNFLIEKLPL